MSSRMSQDHREIRRYTARTLWLVSALIGLLAATTFALAPTATARPASAPLDGCLPADLVQDGGFEAGLPNPVWQTSSNVFSDILDDTSDPAPRTGIWKAWMGGDNLVQESLWQTFSVPADVAGLEIRYWWRVDTRETSHPFDTLQVEIRDTNSNVLQMLETLTDGNAGAIWQESAFTLTGYAGQTIQIAFEAQTDGTGPTNFLLDDVSVLGSCAPTPTPTATSSPTATPIATSTPGVTLTPTATSPAE
ncbi:MAG: choice-of-anchor J domain-containing protein, partial [Anaerolineae bacterium]